MDASDHQNTLSCPVCAFPFIEDHPKQRMMICKRQHLLCLNCTSEFPKKGLKECHSCKEKLNPDEFASARAVLQLMREEKMSKRFKQNDMPKLAHILKHYFFKLYILRLNSAFQLIKKESWESKQTREAAKLLRRFTKQKMYSYFKLWVQLSKTASPHQLLTIKGETKEEPKGETKGKNDFVEQGMEKPEVEESVAMKERQEEEGDYIN